MAPAEAHQHRQPDLFLEPGHLFDHLFAEEIPPNIEPVLHDVGTIGPGLAAGLVGMTRPSQTVSGRASGDEYSLDIYPFVLNAVLRADAFWHGAGVPLVPYGKLGLGYGLWRSSNSGGRLTAEDCKPAGMAARPQLQDDRCHRATRSRHCFP